MLDTHRTSEQKPDELIQGDTLEAYEEIAKELEYEALGMLPDDELNEFILNPGTFPASRERDYLMLVGLQ